VPVCSSHPVPSLSSALQPRGNRNERGGGEGRTHLRLEDGEVLLRADEVAHERVGAREDEAQDEARAVQVEVALCAFVSFEVDVGSDAGLGCEERQGGRTDR